VSGLCHFGNQTGINLLLSQAKLPRLGPALALKQSGMPTASLLGGVAVPVIALTVGRRWAYVIGAVGTVVAIINVRRVIAPLGRMERVVTKTGTPRRSLAIASVGFGLMAFSAGALNAWIVSSGVESGISEARAGPLSVAAALSVVGDGGMALLAVPDPPVQLVATVFAFGVGWVWPVFTNFGVVRANLESAAAATGISQTGVYIGVFLGPLLTGWMIEWSRYSAMWLVTAAAMLVGAAITFAMSREFEDEQRGLVEGP
jgi:hypothetical protein